MNEKINLKLKIKTDFSLVESQFEPTPSAPRLSVENHLTDRYLAYKIFS
jgi:hypothetical protein